MANLPLQTRPRTDRDSGEEADLQRLREAGRQAAKNTQIVPIERSAITALEHRSAEAQKNIETAVRSRRAQDEVSRWLADNYRILRTAEKEVKGLAKSLRHHPGVLDEAGAHVPRAYLIARTYLRAALDRFTEEGVAAFVEGFQTQHILEMGELWALKPALQVHLIEHIARADQTTIAALINSLRTVGEADWKDIFEAMNLVDRILARDPARGYAEMEFESREAYRNAIAELAKHSGKAETIVAESALKLAMEVAGRKLQGRFWERRTHIGFFLVDRGLPELRRAIGYHRPPMQKLRDQVLEYPNGFYLIGIEVTTFLIVVGLLSGLSELTPIVAGFFLLLLPATQAAVDFMNNLTTFLVPPRALPKFDFSKGIPPEHSTLVAVPTLLLNERQVRDLAMDIEIRYLANRDPNLYFALVTDSPDSDQPTDERDMLVDVCVSLIEELNRRHGAKARTPFYLFHRHRIYNPSEGRWMGWERKRGKLLDLNQLMRGGFDSFPVKVGNLDVLSEIRYVITLDSDTQLPRDVAARLVGTIAHPLNRAVIDARSRMVVEGYGILQPRIGVSIQSASLSRLASIYSGQTGFDIYTRAISDVYQDLFSEGIFTGKGIYEIDALRESLEHRFPENALLSHDLIEGAYARAGLASDIELIDDYPSHFSAYSRRKHRWVRGDWQIMRWLLPRVPDFHRNMIPNPISLISRWKILDNLRRSLFEPATLMLLLAGWFYLPGEPWYWTLASVAMLLMPVYSSLLFSLFRIPWGGQFLWAWTKDTAANFLKGHFHALLGIVFLLHQAMLSLDAIVRSILRVYVYKKRLLEWETAAEAETAARRRAKVDIYLDWSPWIGLIIGFALALDRPEALPVAAPILFLWFSSRVISDWLNRAPRASNKKLTASDIEFIRGSAERMWAFFRDWSTPETNWLIPDNVLESDQPAMRLSPTNLGFLLNARIAAVHFGWLTVEEFATQTLKTLETVDRLPKYRGHLMNWYDVETLAPLSPQFVSTVDSGNLAGCLWTLKQAALAWIPENTALVGQLTAVAAAAQRLAADMDFSFLYHERKKVLSVGYDVTAERLEPSSYDLLASESRIASFVGIAKGEIPQEAWFHLGRRLTVYGGERVLVSWTGTIFEYLMPAIWMRHYRDTIMRDSMEAAVRVQCDYAVRKGMPWGISESACLGLDADSPYGYAAFGIPELAMKRVENKPAVISPYSSFLSLLVAPRSSAKNLRAMDAKGWSGKYGLYEAIDYTRGGPQVVRSWMAHHVGMSLLAACNLLFENPFQRYFHAEPYVLATELLLHERVPSAVAVEAEELHAPATLAAEASV